MEISKNGCTEDVFDLFLHEFRFFLPQMGKIRKCRSDYERFAMFYRKKLFPQFEPTVGPLLLPKKMWIMDGFASVQKP